MSGTKTTSKTVSVGCKLPNGLVINFETFNDVSKTWIKTGEVELKGANSSSIVGGYGITDNVDAEAFAEWLKIHKDDETVKLGLIFAQPTPAGAEAAAKERADTKSGFEPIDPDKPGPRIERADPPTKR
jgi:hypothetical protein